MTVHTHTPSTYPLPVSDERDDAHLWVFVERWLEPDLANGLERTGWHEVQRRKFDGVLRFIVRPRAFSPIVALTVGFRSPP